MASRFILEIAWRTRGDATVGGYVKGPSSLVTFCAGEPFACAAGLEDAMLGGLWSSVLPAFDFLDSVDLLFASLKSILKRSKEKALKQMHQRL